jgi:hypothetical protein
MAKKGHYYALYANQFLMAREHEVLNTKKTTDQKQNNSKLWSA